MYMKRTDPVELALVALREAADVTPFLRHKNHRVVAKAAGRAGAMGAGVAQELVEAFRRILPGGAKSDPGCVAKLAIVRALVEREDNAAEAYFAGARHVQQEPVWEGTVDTAAELRGLCAVALSRTAHPEALLEAVRLLSDKESAARTGAVRALADSGRPDAELLLRYKADSGDQKSEVEGECFAALLRLGPRSRSVPFVTEFLKRGSEEAAIALGESRFTEAWTALKDAFAAVPSSQSAVMLGMSLLRNDEAIEFLFERVEKDRERVAAVAIAALASYSGDEALHKRMKEILANRDSPALQKSFDSNWR
jgi:HEAT repeat protein